MSIGNLSPADQIVAAMKRIYCRGLTTTSGGNLSILDEKGNIWITPSGLDKGSLTRDQICCVRPDNTVAVGEKPSIELAFHRAIYQVRPDIRAVLHAHPPALVAFSIAHAMPTTQLLAPVAAFCEKLGCADYAVPGSNRLQEYLSEEFRKGNDIVIMENHGVCVGANDMVTAFRQLETLEVFATIEEFSHRLGRATAPGNEEISRYVSLFHAYKETASVPIGEEDESARRLVSFVNRAYSQQLFTGALGCMSLRIDQDTFLITPPGVDFGSLKAANLICVKMSNAQENSIAFEVNLHARIYQRNPNINCVIGACPVYSMSFGVTDTPLDLALMPESYVQLRKLSRILFNEGLENPGKIACMLSQSAPTLLWENSQLIVVGDTLLQAFDRLEVVERTAQAIWMVQDIGKPVRLSDEELAEF